MKTKAINILTIVILALVVAWSCSKKEDNTNFRNGEKDNKFVSGQPNNNFVNGEQGNAFINNECIVGAWISPQSSWSSCPQGYHLKLLFNQGGTGESWHLDEYLCINDMHKYFKWTQSSDSLFIVFDDETGSRSRFKCPSNQMMIYWNGNNPKFLTKQ